MHKRALLVVSVIAILALGVVAVSYAAQDKPAGPPGPPAVQSAVSHPAGPPEQFGEGSHHRHGFHSMLKKLGITDDQKKQIRALYVGFRDRTRKTRTDLMSLKDEKKTMFLSGKIDQQKLAQLDDQIVKLKTDVMKEALKLKRDRLAVLTPEQIERVADWKAAKAFRARMKGMHHRGGMPGKGMGMGGGPED